MNEPADDMDVGMFSFTSFLRRLAESCCALALSALLLPDVSDFVRFLLEESPTSCLPRLSGLSAEPFGLERLGSSSDDPESSLSDPVSASSSYQQRVSL